MEKVPDTRLVRLRRKGLARLRIPTERRPEQNENRMQNQKETIQAMVSR